MKSVSIIPNKDILNIPIYHMEDNEKDHRTLLQEFCNEIGLDYTSYRNVYECLLAYGLVTIITKNKEYALTWLPEYLNNEQCEKLFSLEEFYLLFKDLEFIDLYNNGLGKFSDKENTGKEVLTSFYEALRNYHASKVVKDRKVS